MGRYAETARLLDPAAVRSILLALRNDVDRFDAPEDPDPALLDPVERPFESVADATNRLSRLETRLRERSDRRAVFLTIYVRMTREVRERIDGERFADPDWMRRYLVTFADYYRRAFLAFERGRLDDVPDPWRVAFGTAIRGDALVVQDAFLGMNAHINYDLALALSDVGIDPGRSRKYADHRAIDDVLARLVDAQQDALAEHYASGVADVDGVFGQFDERLTLRSLRGGREMAWRVAVVRTDVGLPPVPSYARWVLRVTATGGAFFVLGPAIDPAVQRTLREVEREGVELDVLLERVQDRVDSR